MLRTVSFAARRASALRACRPFASASPAVNWEDIEKVVKTEQGKRELLSLRSAFSEVSSKLQTLSEPVPEINLSELEGSVDAEVLSEYKKAIASIEWPSYKGTELEEVQAEFASLQKEADSLLTSSEEQIKFLSTELEKLEKLKKGIQSLTVDEYLADNPEIAKEIDQEAEAKSYMPW